jgi:hypothetical protein
MKKSDRLIVFRLVLGCLAFLMVYTTLDIYRQTQALGVIFSPRREMLWLLVLMTLGCMIEIGGFLLTFTHQQKCLLDFGQRIVGLLPKKKRIIVGLLVVFVFGFAFLMLIPFSELWNFYIIHWLIFGWVVTITTLLLRRLMPTSNWLNILAVAFLLIGTTYQSFQLLAGISAYPFSLSWSEASRYYYASLFYSKKIYSVQVPPSTLHPTRYFMQSIPFLIGTLPLWFHRLWQVFLWLFCSFGTAAALARRLRITSKVLWWLFLAWAFLFLYQGPVYYHLLVMIMVVLWGFDNRRFWQSLLIVSLASAWAGVSRVNWFPVPGMLAATLYFLEKPQKETSLWKYLFPPLVWASIGFGFALGTQVLYMIWSGNDVASSTSSFSSLLLGNRLFPNPTYSLGLLPGIILISLPIFGVIGLRLRSRILTPIAMLGIVTILGVLLLGGLIVSLKIGGGSNLHNLDAYMTILLVTGSYFWFGRTLNSESVSHQTQILPAWFNLFIVFVPVYFALNSTSHLVRYSPETTLEALSKMQTIISSALEDGGEVLFITERHLLTFDYIKGVPLVPEYEKIFLMEMVMSGNKPYLEKFYKDINNYRFDLIITDALLSDFKPNKYAFSEENNLWAEYVSIPVLDKYIPIDYIYSLNIQILKPRY